MEILYSDNRILVCLKPVGLVSTDEPDGMPEHLRTQLGDPHACIRTVHRLDAAVSGVMVFARSRMASELLSAQIRAHQFEKEYLAVLSGIPSNPEGTLLDRLCYDRATRTASIASADCTQAKDARLDYRVLQVHDNHALVHIRLHTGRTHQIRIQFASRGLALLGDRKYATQAPFPIALWSYRIRFSHPQTGAPLEFSHLPPDCLPWTQFSLTSQSF